jgi:short-subunit dehydrogenase
MASFAGKIVLLTGASGGIGDAIARRLAAGGARLILVGRSVEKLQSLRSALAPVPGGHLLASADITTQAGRDLVRNMLAGLAAPIDVLINGAGVSRFALLAQSAPSDIEAQIGTNVVAPILVTQLVLPFLDCTRGRVINIGSSFGGIGYAGFSSYCASKFALRGFTEALRRELADSRLQIAYLAPRATSTPLNSAAVCAMNDALGNATDPPELVAASVERMLRAPRMRDRAMGWPERVFLRINAIFPSLVDGALRKQLAAIKRFAAAPAAAEPAHQPRP